MQFVGLGSQGMGWDSKAPLLQIFDDNLPLVPLWAHLREEAAAGKAGGFPLVTREDSENVTADGEGERQAADHAGLRLGQP